MIGLLNGMDLMVFIVCILILLISGRSSSGGNSSDNYFMADRRLPWWSVAGSIYGTNVSLSQIIGMLGIGYSIVFGLLWFFYFN